MDTLAKVENPLIVWLKSRRPRWNPEHVTIAVFLFPTLFLMAAYIVWPLISSFNLSLYEWNGLDPVKTPVGLENWDRLIHDDIFWKAFRNNLTLVVLSIAIQIPMGVALAVLLEVAVQRPLLRPFFKIFKTVYFFPMLMSSVAIGILFKYIYDPTFGIINEALEYAGLETWTRAWLGEKETVLYAVTGVICWQFTPFYMILFIAALSSISDDLRDAARIDGATEARYYLRIAVPLISGTISTGVVLALIGSLKYFDLIWVMTEGGPTNSSELMATYMYKKAFPSFQMGYGSAISSALFVIVMAISLTALFLTRRFETEV